MKTAYLMYPQQIGTIAPEIYGHFAEHIGGVIYDGIWVGEDSSVPNVNGFRKELIEKLRAIKAPVIRWPGGCFAETYDWRDGIGTNRPTRINWWTKMDGRYESNTVGTHEFMDFCEAVGAKAYFAANMTTVSPLHNRDWMDYCLSPKGSTTLAKEREANGHPEPFDIPYWGVGNECWGDGGNMTATQYADEFRRYAVVMDNTADADLIACGASGANYRWTHDFLEGVLEKKKNNVNGYSIHIYNAFRYSDAVNFNTEEWYEQLRQAAGKEAVIQRHWDLISAYDMKEHCRFVIDEWGCWHKETGSGPSGGANLLEQQNTMRDAMVAALSLNMFNRHCDKIMMTNIAQLVNNLQCLFFAGGEHCITTPTYHVFDMYKEHQGAQAIQVTVTDNDVFEQSVSISASVKDGKTLVTLGNLSCEQDAQIKLEGVGASIPHTAQATMLYHEDIHAHNTFEKPEEVKTVEVTLDPTQPITIPKAAVLAIRF